MLVFWKLKNTAKASFFQSLASPRPRPCENSIWEFGDFGADFPVLWGGRSNCIRNWPLTRKQSKNDENLTLSVLGFWDENTSFFLHQRLARPPASSVVHLVRLRGRRLVCHLHIVRMRLWLIGKHPHQWWVVSENLFSLNTKLLLVF